jgi:hypothetical protein
VAQEEKDTHRADEIGEITQKYGDISVRTLRRVYGLRFAWNNKSDSKLADGLRTMNATSLNQLVRHHRDGTLATRIAKVSG